MSTITVPVSIALDGVQVPTTLSLDQAALLNALFPNGVPGAPSNTSSNTASVPQVSFFYAHRNGVNQPPLPDGSYGNVVMTATRWNVGNLFDVTKSWAKMPGPGTFITAGQGFDLIGSAGANPTYCAKVIKNGQAFGGDDGADVDAEIASQGSMPGYPAIPWLAADRCALNDTYEVVIYATGGGSLDGNPAHTFWWGLFIPDPA